MTVQALQGLTQKHSPDEVFLCETKATKTRVEKLRNMLGYDHVDFVEAEQWHGGISFLWKDSLGWEVIYKSNWIMGILIPKTGGGWWALWTCYCPAERSKRSEFWDNLGELIKGGTDSWACIDNFNEVMDQSEKIGRREVTKKNNFFLRKFLNKVHGIDIGFSGNIFTWCNKRSINANIRERLDRVMASTEWRTFFWQCRCYSSKCNPIRPCAVTFEPFPGSS